jgi:hypothetical protein
MNPSPMLGFATRRALRVKGSRKLRNDRLRLVNFNERVYAPRTWIWTIPRLPLI